MQSHAISSDLPNPTLNGLDTTQMFETIGVLKADPSLARFQFRATNRWIDGGENLSTIRGFFGAGAEDTSREKAWELTNGEPPVLLGSNEAPNPVEYLLHALAGCVTTTLVLHAAARGIRITQVSTELEGAIDLQGFLALDADVTPGYEEIRMRMAIEADCSDEELDTLLAFAGAHSPVCNTIRRPVPVTIERIAG